MDRLHLMHDIRGKIQILIKLIENNRITEKRRYKMQILCWIYIGISEHQLHLSKLDRVAKTYKRIGLVPEGYMQADLYLRWKPTNTIIDL